MQKDGLSDEHINQQYNESHIHESSNTNRSAFELGISSNRSLSKYFKYLHTKLYSQKERYL